MQQEAGELDVGLDPRCVVVDAGAYARFCALAQLQTGNEPCVQIRNAIDEKMACNAFLAAEVVIETADRAAGTLSDLLDRCRLYTHLVEACEGRREDALAAIGRSGVGVHATHRFIRTRF